MSKHKVTWPLVENKKINAELDEKHVASAVTEQRRECRAWKHFCYILLHVEKSQYWLQQTVAPTITVA